MVYRVYVEKKKELAQEAQSFAYEAKEFLGITSLLSARVLNRYDVENIDGELFNYCVNKVFAQLPTDDVSYNLPNEGTIFAVQYLDGQFDQRADSAVQCIKLISPNSNPVVRTAKVYVLYGDISKEDLATIQRYVVNPVESRQAQLELPDTLTVEQLPPQSTQELTGFCHLNDQQLAELIKQLGLALAVDDAQCIQRYFASEGRNPTLTEIRIIDTYWSDHCRHTTFLTHIDDVVCESPLHQRSYQAFLADKAALGSDKPVTLMGIATQGAKLLKSQGKLTNLDESQEINACTVKIKVQKEKGGEEDYLLLFKNETHNHPTEIEPFGGAATCIGGAIRDPLSGRAYVYGAMRVSGAANPTQRVDLTLAGKLPQRKIVTTAANGYSSYGNQIGLATGLVEEIYHSGYAAKHLEIGAVIGSAPQRNVVRLTPQAGDAVILLGGATGRDGCGGATGSSKAHDKSSLLNCGAEVQKGNAPEERKLQRLFRNAAARLIKRCNDFGAGGVCVAVGELADGVNINLNAVPKKYEGLSATELAISESQERMAVVVDSAHVKEFLTLAAQENLMATQLAVVTEQPRLVMNFNGVKVADISREFLNSNGAQKHVTITPTKERDYAKPTVNSFATPLKELLGDLNVCSKRGLVQRFDSTIGAATVILPYGGRYQLTPAQVMAHKVATPQNDSLTCSLMSYGYNPFISSCSPYHGAYLAVTESLAKLVAAGGRLEDAYLTFQEYFGKPLNDGKRWGKPFAALLGAYDAQKELGVAAIGGKDSMSGSYEQLDVPPTLVSFAVATRHIDGIITNEFKKADSRVLLLAASKTENNLPCASSQKRVFDKVSQLIEKGAVLSAQTVTYGGVAESVVKMALGNKLGFTFNALDVNALFEYNYGAFVLEMASDVALGDCEDILVTELGYTKANAVFSFGNESVELEELLAIYEGKLNGVYPCATPLTGQVKSADYFPSYVTAARPQASYAAPRVLLPVFAGTNCEYDSANALRRAGAVPEIFVINNLSSEGILNSARQFADKLHRAQALFISGGFSGGDEPDGSGKLIAAFMSSSVVKDEITRLLQHKKGLILGICNGFQALLKLGLLPYGEIRDIAQDTPTLTYNVIGRHQSGIVRTRVCSTLSPWLSHARVGEVVAVPISHGEGRFYCNQCWLDRLTSNGQIATQYVDNANQPSMEVAFNPNGSCLAIEGITSPDGRVFGKMGHSERIGDGLYRNLRDNYDLHLFEALVAYYK